MQGRVSSPLPIVMRDDSLRRVPVRPEWCPVDAGREVSKPDV